MILKKHSIFYAKSLLRLFEVLLIEVRSSITLEPMDPNVQTSLQKGGYPRHPVIVYDTRLEHKCGTCKRDYKNLYYYIGDPCSDRKYDHGMICVDCYVRSGDDIILKMRIERL